jgi:hypothetical protein
MKHISLQLNEGQLKQITKQVRDSGGADNRFDVNLLEGKLSENKWADMLETIEFKKDYKAWKTGNVAVEYANNGKPSGIAVTQAKYVAYVLVDEKQNENVAIFLNTEILQAMCRQYLGHAKRDVKGGDNHDSSLILLPISEMLNPEHLFGIKQEEPSVVYGDTPKSEMDWLFVCPDCDYPYNSNAKSLYMNCPKCAKDDKRVRMLMH